MGRSIGRPVVPGPMEVKYKALSKHVFNARNNFTLPQKSVWASSKCSPLYVVPEILPCSAYHREELMERNSLPGAR